jgi:hypothetical protein
MPFWPDTRRWAKIYGRTGAAVYIINYLFAKYHGPNAGSALWYVGNLFVAFRTSAPL